jgi:hypothetical protein
MAQLVVYLVAAFLENVTQAHWVVPTRHVSRQLLLGVKKVTCTIDRGYVRHDEIGKVMEGLQKRTKAARKLWRRPL